MPKAQSGFDEDEKTTIESGWEDEASTTVEQGEVAEKIRSLGVETPLRVPGRNNTNITSTNGGALDEPTVDDQRANAALSLITPSVAPARIVVTVGNDKGQELEIRPGKTYTVGRAIDNDFVLTDIAVSRKHFDLRHENGTWIVVDRGSGNGTVVNGTIEDHPFVLMNGDAIEIGNTSFRFDHANQPARARNSVTFDVDEEEPSTVAGKPLRDDIPSAGMMPPMPRPKTQPPPAPLPRPRTQSSGPPAGYASPMNGARGSIPPVPSAAPIGQPIHQHVPQQMPQMGGPIGVPMASPTAPTVQPMANMPAMRPQMAPQMLDPNMHGMNGHGMNGHGMNGNGGMNGMLRPQMLHNAHEGMQPLPGMMPTTIPGQGPPVAPSQPQVGPFSYPNVGDMQPQLAQLQINGGIPRDATSTALVQPVPYGANPMAAYGLAQPQPQGISKKVKVLLGGALLMVLAAIATIAIIKSSSSSATPKTKASTTPTVDPVKNTGATETKTETKSTETKSTETKVVVPVDTKKAEEQKKLEEAKKLDAQKKVEEQKKLDAEKKAEEQKKLAEEQKKLAEEQKKLDAEKKLEAKKAAEEQKKLDAENKAEELRQKKLEAQKKAEEAKKKKAEKLSEKKKTTNNTSVTIKDDASTTTPSTTTTTTTPSTTKKGAPADTSDVKAKAEDLYRNKKFNDAAKTLRTTADKLGEADARDLRSVAAVYEQVGKAYNVGMGPATPPVEAYTNLERALNLDRPIGVFSDEIKTKLAAVAPKAAAKFMADKNYEAAFRAVRVAESNGGSNSTTSSVREALVGAANDLYAAAMEEKSSNPSGARAKLQRIKGMVDKAPVLVKAEKALRELPK